MNAESYTARRAFDCIADMKSADGPDALLSTVGPLFRDIGLPHFALARFFQPDHTPDVAVIAGRFHQEWAERFIRNHYVRHSVIARELLHVTEPYSWSGVLARRPIDEAQIRIKREADELGLTDGLFTPVRWHDGSYAAVVLAGDRPEIGDRFVETLGYVLSGYFASEMRRFSLPAPAPKLSLSARQRECLAWVRQGKSSSAIAEILGIGVFTVDEHIKEACRKLGVRTRVQAAVEVSVAGLID
jgi:LuxR family quorum-sensing system transcriptional regulator CciR